ncbi:hypothetical protein CCZ01_03000 [Helicobacter monodelphidis]|uniref:efflux RND transporter periplasmic adaptor subunit n=1 Tax=Helicobacter sp. 15-1451 TaxID=2004995 RepID=UPI000DCB8D66|nr:efflux RND transporter periplasmic adaptor subunit [Helicobacter sp. 15-1451]RAX58399.1 hypothetical protein CCZ01_03000 [Helicobacter sp. 15-1451]
MKLMSFKKNIALLLCGVVFLGGCGGSEEAKNAQGVAGKGAGQQMPAIKANTMQISKGDQPLQFEYPARVRSIGTVEVYAKVSGTLLEQLYTEGQYVEQGTPLYKIDPDKYQATYQEALAALEVRKANLMQAERNWERSSTLFEQKALSQKEKDDALAAYESAKANVTNAEATLQRAELDLGYTTITAPISGMSGMKLQDIGTYVGISGNSTVTTITQVAPIHIEFAVADITLMNTIARMRSGGLSTEEIKIKVLDRMNNVLDEGVIDFIDSRIDETIGSVKLRAIVPNEKKMLMPGQFVRVGVEGVKLQNAATIPQKAILQTSQGVFIYLLKEGKAQMVPVSIEQSIGSDFVVTGLFEDGDELILNNLMMIRPNAPVQADNGGK